MATDRTRDLLFPITILIAVAVGAVIGGSFARSGFDSRPQTGTPTADPKPFVDAMDALRAELARTREKLKTTSNSPAASDRSETRSVAPDMSSELRKATTQLIEAADSLRTTAQRSTGDRAPLIDPVAVDPERLKELMAQPNEESAKAYQMWTYQQVMDRSGHPSGVHPTTSGLYWVYYDPITQHSVIFTFTDGRVSEVSH